MGHANDNMETESKLSDQINALQASVTDLVKITAQWRLTVPERPMVLF